MLVEFRVENFRSFRNQQRLALVASNDRLLPQNIFQSDVLKNALVRSAVVYGPNASGKSNLVMALAFVRTLVRSSVSRAMDKNEHSGRLLPKFDPFLFDMDSNEQPTSFELTFIHNRIRYEYGFILDRKAIHEEWLFAYTSNRAQRWYTRKRQDNGEFEWYFGPKLLGEKHRFASFTRPDVLFLSVGAALNHPQLLPVYHWFSDHLRMITPFTSEHSMERFTIQRSSENQEFHDRIVSLLAEADLGITGFSTREVPIEEDLQDSGIPSDLAEALRSRKATRLEIMMEHQSPEQPKPVTLSNQDESLGTRRLFTIAGPLIDALLHGRTLVVDELDDSLHPILVRRIIELFHDPEINQNNAQLIFNTHDATLLDIRLFRRDQIWFVERDRAGASQLYPLSDYAPRNDESLMRGYLQGRYGAVPFINTLRESVLKYEVTPSESTKQRGDDDQTHP